MNRRELIQAIGSGAADREFLQELEATLEEELCKPVSDRDFDLIDDLTQAISMLDRTDTLIAEKTESGIAELDYQLCRKSIRRWKKKLTTVLICAAAAGLCCLLSVSAFGMRKLPGAYRMSDGGVQINVASSFGDEIKAENPYAEEMRKICDAQGFSPLIPSYIPDGFAPEDLYGKVQDYETYCSVRFDFKYQNAKLNLMYWDYENAEEIPDMGSPSASYNVTQELFGETVVHIVKEDNQYTAVFMIDRTQYMLFADGLDFDECRHVLESLFS